MKKLLLFGFFLLHLSLFAQKIPPRPHQGKVFDYAKIFSETENKAVEERLEALQKQHTAQIWLITIQSLKKYSLQQWATQLRNTWQASDSTVIVLVAQKDNLAYIAPAKMPLSADFCRKTEIFLVVKGLKQTQFFEASNQTISWIRANLAGVSEKEILGQIEAQNQASAPSWVFFAQLTMFFLMTVLMLWLAFGGIFKKKSTS